MKKIAICALLGVLLMPIQSFAADKIGIYITPKLSWMFSSSDVYTYLEEVHSSSSQESHSDNIFGGALAIGYDFSIKFGINLRTELEYALYADTKDGRGHSLFYDNQNDPQSVSSKTSISTLFINLYYDFKNSTKFTPYIGAGIGIAFIGVQGTSLATTTNTLHHYAKNTTNNFAWNVGFGVAYLVHERVSFDLGYRYSQFGDAYSKYTSDTAESLKIKIENLDAHQIMLGVRFTF